ncbi:hypothetical protein AX769_07190 [Frondihabitans sp. PAMC 28766]|uniref:crotonase/enoyl-CoA hydratase family protein n=1 Tax=Frondihabitans sp. PAMC 28766 TaxID=1795630 RepID=UPI00078B3B25|nr:crotonase/enoyl-CoA hydratase family protein [Frondihabitans sp. PAMC 28766]AMM19983.1 hypothetical protein AX769_07190 [Frondihabitans sp. PAMC 28766]
MPYSVVRIDDSGPLRVLTLDRPAVMNAVDAGLNAELERAVDDFDERDDLRVMVVTGAGGNFCTGLDLKAFAATGVVPRGRRGFGGMTAIRPSKPVIAAVEGYAVAGGFELVLACDLVVAARDATFGLPEVRSGLVAIGGGAQLLPRRIPRARAMDILLTGRFFTAPEADAWGLLAALAEPGQALLLAREFAEAIAANSPQAIATTRGIVDAIERAGVAGLLPAGDDLTRSVTDSADAREGAAAFAEKRRPHWS